MADSFQKLREILQTDKIPADTSQFSEVGYRSLLETLDAAGTSYAPGMGDIAALIRQVLRREYEQKGRDITPNFESTSDFSFSRSRNVATKRFRYFGRRCGLLSD